MVGDVAEKNVFLEDRVCFEKCQYVSNVVFVLSFEDLYTERNQKIKSGIRMVRGFV